MQNPNPSIATGVEGEDGHVIPWTETGQSRVDHEITNREQHLSLTQVAFHDVTDLHGNLVHENEWLLHPSCKILELQGCLFVLHERQNNKGMVFIKQKPLPHARPIKDEPDLRIRMRKDSGFDFFLLESRDSPADSWVILEYEGGVAERTRVLHDWQKAQRPATPGHRAIEFLSNTWGDRSRDSRIQEEFLLQETAAAARLGADIMQIDDGWQKGITSNSAYQEELGGIWEGFWNADPDFWQIHPERLPNGLQPVVDCVREHGLALGLWFNPDSWNDYAHWEKDASRLVEIYRTFGVRHFKIDGIRAETENALANLRAFFRSVLDQTMGEVVFDLDITAGVRPGYFGEIPVGPLFVENRYTDWHNYWPHQALRVLWTLSRWIPPSRLRLEFLNNTRNLDRYGDDPLAPSHYSPDTLFATVMFSNPLGWFEASNLPQDYFETIPPLVQTWKKHREAIFASTVLPIGDAPDGFNFSGFFALAPDGKSGYLLAFRGLTEGPSTTMELPVSFPSGLQAEVLGGKGNAYPEGDSVRISIEDPLGFAFVRLA